MRKFIIIACTEILIFAVPFMMGQFVQENAMIIVLLAAMVLLLGVFWPSPSNSAMRPLRFRRWWFIVRQREVGVLQVSLAIWGFDDKGHPDDLNLILARSADVAHHWNRILSGIDSGEISCRYETKRQGEYPYTMVPIDELIRFLRSRRMRLGLLRWRWLAMKIFGFQQASTKQV